MIFADADGAPELVGLSFSAMPEAKSTNLELEPALHPNAPAGGMKSSIGDWLPNMDLNHDKQIQSLLCYRYTIRQVR